MSGGATPIPPRVTAIQARALVERDLGASIVESPATGIAGGGSAIPGLGSMPSPGHFMLALTVEQRLTRYLFAR